MIGYLVLLLAAFRAWKQYHREQLSRLCNREWGYMYWLGEDGVYRTPGKNGAPYEKIST